MYCVETYTVFDGWVNCWTVERGNTSIPETFKTENDAIAALREHFEDLDAASMNYDPEDYRVRQIAKLSSQYQPDQHPVQYCIDAGIANAMFRNGMVDTSWRNDICASFTLHESDQCLRIWIEAIDFDDRESENPQRFTVMLYTTDMEYLDTLLETDSILEALGCVMRHKSFK